MRSRRPSRKNKKIILFMTIENLQVWEEGDIKAVVIDFKSKLNNANKREREEERAVHPLAFHKNANLPPHRSQVAITLLLLPLLAWSFPPP